MQNISKLLLGTLFVLALPACNRDAEPNQAPAAAAPEPADIVVAPSLVPAAAGITTLDAQQLSTITTTKAPCQLDFVAKQAVAAQPATLTVGQKAVFQGWIGNPGLQPPDAFAIVLDGAQSYAFRGTAGADRPDVAKVLKADGMAKSGYNVEVKLDGVEPGEYGVSFIQDTSSGTIRCLTPAKVVLSAS